MKSAIHLIMTYFYSVFFFFNKYFSTNSTFQTPIRSRKPVVRPKQIVEEASDFVQISDGVAWNRVSSIIILLLEFGVCDDGRRLASHDNKIAFWLVSRDGFYPLQPVFESGVLRGHGQAGCQAQGGRHRWLRAENRRLAKKAAAMAQAEV